MKEPGFFSDSLPEGVPPELTVSELEEMACRQQQQIESQRQLLAAKEQRLRFLKQHEAKHQQVVAEHERLRRLRDRVEAQEQKLRKLRALRGQVDQTKSNNVSLTSDLESIRALFNEKEKELSVAVAKVEELTRQLEELQRGRDSNGDVASSSSAIELDKLRAELLYRNKLNEQQSARLSHQRDVLVQRQEEMVAIDRRIAELQERLHRKRLLNQQLANHINKQQQPPPPPPPHENHQNIQYQQLCKYYVKDHQQQSQKQIPPSQAHHQQRLHQMQQQMQYHQPQLTQSSYPVFQPVNMSNKNVPPSINNAQPAGGANLLMKPSSLTGKTGPGTNIAAVEPYHHVPLAKSNHFVQGDADAKRNHRKPELTNYNVETSQNQRNLQPYTFPNQKDIKHSINEERLHNISSPAALLDDEGKQKPIAYGGGGGAYRPTATVAAEEKSSPNFWPNKFDSKYQTLPSSAKFSNHGTNVVTVNKYTCRVPAEGTENTILNSHESVNQKSNTTDSKKSLEDNFNNNNNNNNSSVKEEVDTADSANIVSNQQIARSIPIQTSISKGLATSLSNMNINNHISRCDNDVNGVTSRPYEITPYCEYNGSPANVQCNENYSNTAPVTASNTAVTFINTYQKPVSSVSPIYQTSSTKIQPVHPQIIGSLSSISDQEIRKNYSQNVNDAITSPTENSISSKPALPPKPAQPVKPTPPPPPRQSAFHTQYVSQSENKCNDSRPIITNHNRTMVDENKTNSETFGRSSESTDEKDKKFYSTDSLNSNLKSRPMININSRNGYLYDKDTMLKKAAAESPPPLPSVEPPSDDEIEKLPTMKLKTVYVQQQQNNNNKNISNDIGVNNRNKENNRISQLSVITDRLMPPDLSQDSSSSDSSSVENNYLVGTNRRIELPPAYLFPENESHPADLMCSNNEKDESSDDTDHCNIILNIKNSSSEQMINQEKLSENEKFSVGSSSPDSEDSEKMKTFNNEIQLHDDIKKIKKGNLKNNNSVNNKRRVSFDPLALLLDASLEGELELVIRTASQVKNPSAANDEGITALHNAICAGHFEIVRFLVQFGCDVNAQDSDGWTPLHCAASCNNLPMVRFLVEHGACIFATTLSDQETAAEKCEEDEEGFDGCSEFLYSVQEKLGILNNGVVYAVFDYEAHNPDELCFKEGDRLTVLRKGDEWEREWWWSRLNDKEGYIPRNLLGLYPRIHPTTNRIQD